MPSSRATVPTPDAARYLKRLCNHFAHKLPVELTEDRGVLTSISAPAACTPPRKPC